MTVRRAARLPGVGLGLTAGGALSQLAGLAVDARLHAADPGLAARETVLSLSNLGHLLLLCGLAGVTGGVTVLLVAPPDRAAPGRPPAGRRRRLGPAAVAAAALLSATAAAAATRGGPEGAAHDHAGPGAGAGGHGAGQPAPPAPAGAGRGTGHGHGPAVPALDPEAARRLDAQLAAARAVAARYPTVADAVADGFRPATPYDAGIGAHYLRFADVDEVFEVERPEMLLYAGDAPASQVVGLSYYVVGSAPPEGFEGKADAWHRHLDTCLTPEGPVFAGDGYRRCRASGRHGWMLHAWVVAGWDSPEGVFSAANARLS